MCFTEDVKKSNLCELKIKSYGYKTAIITWKSNPLFMIPQL